MTDFAYQFAIRLAVLLPVIMLVSALAWFALKRRAVVKPSLPFDAADMRTWSLGFAMTDAVIYAIIFAAITALMSESEMSAAVAAGVSALVAIGLAPRLMQHFSRR